MRILRIAFVATLVVALVRTGSASAAVRQREPEIVAVSVTEKADSLRNRRNLYVQDTTSSFTMMSNDGTGSNTSFSLRGTSTSGQNTSPMIIKVDAFTLPRIPMENVTSMDGEGGEFGSMSVSDNMSFGSIPASGEDDLTAQTVFGTDDRVVFKDTSYPYGAVGRVVNSRGGVCTGTLVGRRLVLTAVHCLSYNSDGSLGRMTFTPAYYDGSAPFGIATVSSALYWNVGLRGDDGLTGMETAYDYAILVLSSNTALGDQTGWFGYTTYQAAWNNGKYWSNIGYPGALTNTQRPVFSSGGSITSVQSFNAVGYAGYDLTTLIDIQGGHSGGPIYGYFSGSSSPSVVAVVSGESSATNVAGGGPAMTELIRSARASYP